MYCVVLYNKKKCDLRLPWFQNFWISTIPFYSWEQLCTVIFFICFLPYVQVHGLLSSRNFVTMATWRNDFLLLTVYKAHISKAYSVAVDLCYMSFVWRQSVISTCKDSILIVASISYCKKHQTRKQTSENNPHLQGSIMHERPCIYFWSTVKARDLKNLFFKNRLG